MPESGHETSTLPNAEKDEYCLVGMNINFSKAEEEVLRFWKDIDAFHTQLRLTEGCARFTFYDGPPFGTSTHTMHSALPQALCSPY